MKDAILNHLNQPEQLEKLYRTHKKQFKLAFDKLYPQLSNNTLADYWHIRLHYEDDDINLGSRRDLVFVIIISVIAGVIAKLPALLNINEAFFYTRNAGFIIFPALTACFIHKHKLSLATVALLTGIFLAAAIFINVLPDLTNSDTLLLSCIYMQVIFWSALGFAFMGAQANRIDQRLRFLQYNGDLLVITALLVIAGIILSGTTVGLFELIGFDIKELYFEDVVVFLLPAIPIIGSWLIEANPQLVSKISPVIANIFSPVVAVMLAIYLAAIAYSGKNPYNDREFLFVFNVLLVGVIAIIFFSIAGNPETAKTNAANWMRLLLSVLTIIINSIALSAILFRITQWGITPNRAAVLGTNIIILIQLLLITVQLFKTVLRKGAISGVEKAIARYLPAYVIWAAIVTFLFPFLFGFK